MKSPGQTGFTLLEVLITVVIFSVGLLTVASLQVVARKASFEAVQRTTATHLAQGMLERMRANRRGLFTYVSGGGVGGGTELGRGSRDAPGNTCTNRGSPCTSIDMALADLWEWEQLLDGSYEVAGGESVGGLVLPRACIRGAADAATGLYSVAIAWRGATEANDPPDDDCGAADTDMGDFRRVVVVETFINAL